MTFSRHWFKLLVVLWMLVIFWLSSQSSMPVPMPALFPGQDKLGHLIIYSILGLFVALAFCRDPKKGMCLLLTFSIALLYGISDEWHQSFVPNRDMSGWDLVADALGGLVGGFIARLLLLTRLVRLKS
ncbi:MAG: VanZ family protein [Methylococcales bacterium]|jgi:VanZ family protein|nr:VanZ family protein [Methylococcales bacterium]MBT7444380.1 VanZ family protein [Methylococcales bacterium]